MIRGFAVHSRRSVGPLLLPVMVLVSWYVIKEAGPSTLTLWPDLSEAIRQTVIVLGPIMAGAAAWTAGRNHDRGIDELLASTPYSPAVRDLTIWAAITVWGVTAYLTSALGTSLQAFRDASWGVPNWWSITIGLVGLATCSALGFATGTLIPSRFTSPLTTIATFGALLVPLNWNPDSGFRYLTPLSASPVIDVFFGVRPNVGPELMLWLAGLTIVALSIALLRHERTIALTTMLALGLMLSVVGAILLVNTGPVIISDDDVRGYTPICENHVILICVHPAYETMLPETADAIGAVFEPLDGVPSVPDRAEQRARFSTILPDNTLRFYLHEDYDPGYTAGSVARLLVGEDGSCGTTPQLNEGALPSGYVARNAVAGWLMQQAGFSAGVFAARPGVQTTLTHFASLPSDVRRRWLVQNYSGLRNCRIGVEDMP